MTEKELIKTQIDELQARLKVIEETTQEPSMTICIIEGNPPNGYMSWSEWFNEMGSKGILHNLRISSKEHKNQDELKNLQEKNFYVDSESLLLKSETLYELLEEKTSYGRINMEDAFKIAKGWLMDNTEVVAEDHYTVTLKLNKGVFGGPND